MTAATRMVRIEVFHPLGGPVFQTPAWRCKSSVKFSALLFAAVSAAFAQTPGPADRPAPRTDRNSMTAHRQLVDKAKQGRIDIYFEGDSIARRWGATDYPELLANWKQNFFGWNATDFGWGADLTQNILWRLDNGELDGENPKIVVLLARNEYSVGNAAPLDGVEKGQGGGCHTGDSSHRRHDSDEGSQRDDYSYCNFSTQRQYRSHAGDR